MLIYILIKFWQDLKSKWLLLLLIFKMMKKPGGNIQNSKQFFQEAKEYMRKNNRKQIKMKELTYFSHNSQQVLLGRLVNYINSKSKFDKSLSDHQNASILNYLLDREKLYNQRFRIDAEGISYRSIYYKVEDQKSLLKQIQANPEGLLVDDQLLKFTVTGIRDHIRDLINKRQIALIKSKGIQKSKIKQDNYQGYILYSFPPQIKECLEVLCKTPMKALEKNQFLEKEKDRQKKIQIIYGTKTSKFRKEFQGVCSANNSRGQQKIGGRQNEQSFHSRFNAWEQVNKQSIPNFEKEAEEWFKSRK